MEKNCGRRTKVAGLTPRKRQRATGRDAADTGACEASGAGDSSGPSNSSERPPGPTLASLPGDLLQRIMLLVENGPGRDGGVPCACKALHTAWRDDLHQPHILAPYLASRHPNDPEAALARVHRCQPAHNQHQLLGVVEAQAETRAARLLDLARSLTSSSQLAAAGAMAVAEAPPAAAAAAEAAPIAPAPAAAAAPPAAGEASPASTEAAAAAVVVRVSASARVNDGGVVAAVLQRVPGCCPRADLNQLLRAAVADNRAHVAGALLDGGADINVLFGPDGWDARAALQAGHCDLAEALLSRGALPEDEYRQREVLKAACDAAATGAIRAILRRCSDMFSWTCFIGKAAAASGGQVGPVAVFVEELPQRCFNFLGVDFLQYCLDSELRMAMEGGFPQAVRALIAAGAKTTCLPLCKDVHVDRLQLLVQAGWDCRISALEVMGAAESRQRVMLRGLLDLPIPDQDERDSRMCYLSSTLRKSHLAGDSDTVHILKAARLRMLSGQQG